MLIFPNAPAIWDDCNSCPNLKRCENPFPPSGVCPHPDHILFPYQRTCHSTIFHPFYFSAIARNAELASIFARWQVKDPIKDKDFVAIRNYHLSHPNDKVATSLLCEFLAFPLKRLRDKCLHYYNKTEQEINGAFTGAIFSALSALTSADVAACSAHGGHWTIAFMDAMKFTMRMILKEIYLELDSQNDVDFRATFEQEWRVLLNGYLDTRYNFLIIPRLSYQHMTRYQELAKGDAYIRRTVSTYLIHQCFFYPHISADWMPNLAYDAIWPLIRRAYAPLIGATVARAARNLQLSKDQSGVAAKIDLRIEVEKAFDEFASKFDFFLDAPDKFMGHGVLGLNENNEAQAEINKLLELFGFSERSTDINSTPFAHYIKTKLDLWIAKRYPPLQDFHTSETNVITGSDGQVYLTIEGASRKFGVSVERLRNMDRANALKPIRARDVAPTFPLLAPDIRLYADTPQMKREVEIADARAKTHSQALSGTELNRKQAAIFLKVSYDALREMEKRQCLKPRKNGQSVVYDEALLAQAQAMIAQKQQEES